MTNEDIKAVVLSERDATVPYTKRIFTSSEVDKMLDVMRMHLMDTVLKIGIREGSENWKLFKEV